MRRTGAPGRGKEHRRGDVAGQPLDWVHNEPEPSACRAVAGVVGVLGGPTKGNLVLEQGWQRLGLAASLMLPPAAAATLREGDVALVRLDVLASLDGVEAGLDKVSVLVRGGGRVLHRPSALF